LRTSSDTGDKELRDTRKRGVIPRAGPAENPLVNFTKRRKFALERGFPEQGVNGES